MFLEPGSKICKDFLCANIIYVEVSFSILSSFISAQILGCVFKLVDRMTLPFRIAESSADNVHLYIFPSTAIKL